MLFAICYLQFRLWSRAKRPWILKSAGMSVVRGRTEVYVIPLLFHRSLGRTLLCVSATEQRDRADEQQDGTRSHQFRGRSESDSHKPHSSEAQEYEQVAICGPSGRMTNGQIGRRHAFLRGIRILVYLVADSLHKIARGTSKGAG